MKDRAPYRIPGRYRGARAAAPLDDLNSANDDYGLEDVRSEVVAGVIVDNDNSEGSYDYAYLEQPAVLEPDTEYYLASYEDYDGTAEGEIYMLSSTENYLAYDGNTQGHFGYVYPADPTSIVEGVWKMNENPSPGTPPHWEQDAMNTFTANVSLRIR
ncbi:MAG: hypothetical protein M1457_03350 [bacterium]|nr:hypothetical protein [bacterium]